MTKCQSLVIGTDSLYCGKERKFSNTYCDIDLDRTMELTRDIIIVLRNNIITYILSFLCYCASTHVLSGKHARTHAQTKIYLNK